MGNLWRRLAGLGALGSAATAAVVILADDGRRQARATAAAATAGLLLPELADLDVEAVTELLLEGPGPALRAVRGPGGWRLTAPVPTAAEDTAIDALVAAALRLTGQHRVEAGGERGDAAIFGLAPPQRRLCLAGGGHIGRLEVGRSSSFDGTLYVRAASVPDGRSGARAGTAAGGGTRPARGTADVDAGPEAGPIWQVDGAFAALVDKDLYRLRDKRPLRLDPAGITEVAVTSPGLCYRLARGADGALGLVAPIVAPADAAHVEMVLAALAGTRAQAFVRENAPTADALAPFGLDRPALEVTLSGAVAAPGAPLPTPPAAGRETLRFGEVSLGRGVPQVFVARAGAGAIPVLALDQDWTLSRLRAPLAAVRDLHITHARAGEVACIRIDAAHTSLQLRRGAAGAPAWSALPAAAIDPAAVASMLQQLVGLRGDRVAVEDADAAALAAHGLLPPRLAITLMAHDGACLGRVRIGRAAAGQVAIRAGEGSRIDGVSSAAVSRLTADVGALAPQARPETAAGSAGTAATATAAADPLAAP